MHDAEYFAGALIRHIVPGIVKNKHPRMAAALVEFNRNYTLPDKPKSLRVYQEILSKPHLINKGNVKPISSKPIAAIDQATTFGAPPFFAPPQQDPNPAPLIEPIGRRPPGRGPPRKAKPRFGPRPAQPPSRPGTCTFCSKTGHTVHDCFAFRKMMQKCKRIISETGAEVGEGNVGTIATTERPPDRSSTDAAPPGNPNSTTWYDGHNQGNGLGGW